MVHKYLQRTGFIDGFREPADFKIQIKAINTSWCHNGEVIDKEVKYPTENHTLTLEQII